MMAVDAKGLKAQDHINSDKEAKRAHDQWLTHLR